MDLRNCVILSSLACMILVIAAQGQMTYRKETMEVNTMKKYRTESDRAPKKEIEDKPWISFLLKNLLPKFGVESKPENNFLIDQESPIELEFLASSEATENPWISSPLKDFLPVFPNSKKKSYDKQKRTLIPEPTGLSMSSEWATVLQGFLPKLTSRSDLKKHLISNQKRTLKPESSITIMPILTKTDEKSWISSLLDELYPESTHQSDSLKKSVNKQDNKKTAGSTKMPVSSDVVQDSWLSSMWQDILPDDPIKLTSIKKISNKLKRKLDPEPNRMPIQRLPDKHTGSISMSYYDSDDPSRKNIGDEDFITVDGATDPAYNDSLTDASTAVDLQNTTISTSTEKSNFLRMRQTETSFSNSYYDSDIDSLRCSTRKHKSRKDADRCIYACRNAYKSVCKIYRCHKRLYKDAKRLCKRQCKAEFV